MKEKKVVSRKNLPRELPILRAVVCWLALDHWNAPDWLYGAFGCFFVLYFVAIFIALYKEKSYDIFDNNKETLG